MKISIGITEADTNAAAMQLAKVLADELILYTKTRNAHWNVEGPGFHGLHLFFEMQYEELDKMMDDVAERIRAIGHFAPATLKNILELTRLTEHNSSPGRSEDFIVQLLEDHSSIIFYLRAHIDSLAADYKDFGSSDLLTSVLKVHEKMAWMLRSYLK